MIAGGGSIGGPTRPGVSFSASYQSCVRVGVVVVHAPHDVAAVAADVDVLRLRREDERVDRQMRLQEAPVRLRLDHRQLHLLRRHAQVEPGRHLGDRRARPRPSKMQLRDDLLRPGRAGLGVGRDDDVVVAELRSRSRSWSRSDGCAARASCAASMAETGRIALGAADSAFPLIPPVLDLAPASGANVSGLCHWQTDIAPFYTLLVNLFT